MSINRINKPNMVRTRGPISITFDGKEIGVISDIREQDIPAPTPVQPIYEIGSNKKFFVRGKIGEPGVLPKIEFELDTRTYRSESGNSFTQEALHNAFMEMSKQAYRPKTLVLHPEQMGDLKILEDLNVISISQVPSKKIGTSGE